MQYMLLIFNPEPAADELEAHLGPYLAYFQELEEAGKLRGGHRLAPERESVAIRPQGDSTVVLDGPFAESKEVLGGYAILEVESREEAVELARRCPAAREGQVVLRPVAPR